MALRGQETNLKQILANCLCTRPRNQHVWRAISVLLSMRGKSNSQFSREGPKVGKWSIQRCLAQSTTSKAEIKEVVSFYYLPRWSIPGCQYYAVNTEVLLGMWRKWNTPWDAGRSVQAHSCSAVLWQAVLMLRIVLTSGPAVLLWLSYLSFLLLWGNAMTTLIKKAFHWNWLTIRDLVRSCHGGKHGSPQADGVLEM